MRGHAARGREGPYHPTGLVRRYGRPLPLLLSDQLQGEHGGDANDGDRAVDHEDFHSRERVERGGEEIEDGGARYEDAHIEEGELKRGGRAEIRVDDAQKQQAGGCGTATAAELAEHPLRPVIGPASEPEVEGESEQGDGERHEEDGDDVLLEDDEVDGHQGGCQQVVHGGPGDAGLDNGVHEPARAELEEQGTEKPRDDEAVNEEHRHTEGGP